MTYDFDEVIERKNTDSLKFDFARERGRPEGLLSMWVADMDFRVPPCVTRELERIVRHGIYGYTETKEDYFDAVAAWFREGFGFDTQPEWLVKTPGVVFSLGMAVQAFTKPGDAVIIQQPVYYPFSEVVRDNGRVLVNNSLVYENGRYSIDFEDFERKIIDNNAKLFLLCSPHNPVGRVWTRGELLRLGEICLRHGVTVVADEIHCDFVYSGHTHTIFPSLSPELAQISVLCTAPSKTFNLAGLQASNIFIPNPALREKFRGAIAGTGYSQLNTTGLAACRAAYSGGREWLEQLKAYLTGNLDFLRGFVAERLPGVELVEPEGTYLIWMDFRALGLDRRELESLIVDRAKLWLDGGHIFGSDGEGFERFNIACPRSVLREALERLERAIGQLKGA
ncbi:MAG: pyridoxal phosphate-dependent aminotransferase [Oscillospiraceae bacterium]|jgi:cystathionine beta-lyase|nr:pyridoxal phosphate-dependent aminotransferase [Oscillospiraceae bacterium]